MKPFSEEFFNRYDERGEKAVKVFHALDELIGYCQMTYPEMYNDQGRLRSVSELKNMHIDLVQFPPLVRIDFVNQLKIGQRVIGMITKTEGSIIAFRYWDTMKEEWVSEGSGIESDTEDSYDVRWDDGAHSFGCFLGSKIALCQS